MSVFRCLVVFVALVRVSATASDVPPYMDASVPIEQRAADLLKRMTLEEKIAQTYSPYGGTAESIISKFSRTSVGEISIKTASGHKPQNISMTVATRNKIQKAIMEGSRLKIPVSFSQEALHSGAAGGTVFPESVTMGSTWDPALIEEMYSAVAAEARSIGVDLAFAPVINMWTDSRFGRLQEGFSENPTLTAAYAVAAAKGLQGEQPPGDRTSQAHSLKPSPFCQRKTHLVLLIDSSCAINRLVLCY
jgi:beta-glucosidase